MVNCLFSTRLLMMHDTCFTRGSTRVTSTLPLLHIRIYFATVAPAKPPPTTTTR